jgi:hypothetical protein
MLRTAVKIARPVKVVQNTTNTSVKSHQWGQIRDAVTNEVLHTGQLPYISRIARTRYNAAVEFVK